MVERASSVMMITQPDTSEVVTDQRPGPEIAISVLSSIDLQDSKPRLLH